MNKGTLVCFKYHHSHRGKVGMITSEPYVFSKYEAMETLLPDGKVFCYDDEIRAKLITIFQIMDSEIMLYKEMGEECKKMFSDTVNIYKVMWFNLNEVKSEWECDLKELRDENR